MRILITGEHGYISTSLTEYIGNRHPDWEVERVSVRGEEWKKRSFRDTDVLIHTAGIVHQSEKSAGKEEYKEINISLTLSLAEKCRQEGVGQFIFLSTMSVYGIGQGVIDSESVPKPVTWYGRSKWKAEQLLVKQYSAESGLIITVVRPPMVYGPGCPGNYQSLSRLARRTPFFPKTDNRRSMVYIENLCECLCGLAQQRLSGIYFPQDAEYVDTSLLVQKIAECHGHRCFLIPGFKRILRVLTRCFGTAEKVFGSLTYQQDMSKIPGIAYQITAFQEAVEKTEGAGHKSG